MQAETLFIVRTAMIVALGGFLMGFDASVISGVIGFIEVEFSLSKIELGWAVASLALSSTFAMFAAGPISNYVGRRRVLQGAALLYFVSAAGSALAPDFTSLVIFRMLGGLGVGAALIIAPMYIAEIAPAEKRGRLVSINQLNIVIGISVAFFSNYMILQSMQSDWAQSDWAAGLNLEAWSWRWMLGVEIIPALIYLVGLQIVPESPRWLLMKNRDDEAMQILTWANGHDRAMHEMQQVQNSIRASVSTSVGSFSQLFSPALRLVLIIGVMVAILQQITGINSVFFYAPMIFQMTGIGTDAAFLQALLVGLTNLVFTIIAMLLIDKLGRRPLLLSGVTGIAACMFLLAYGFSSATYEIPHSELYKFDNAVSLAVVADKQFDSDIAFRNAVIGQTSESWYVENEALLVQTAVQLDADLILVGILGFVASFAVSIGPVMWVLFSELFPNSIRALAISFVGLINSGVSFLVQLLFPWELATLGATATFTIYGIFAVIGLVLVALLLPETNGKSLEQLETELIRV